MLDGKANGHSQRFLSIHSVASSLEKPLLQGSHAWVVTMKALLTLATDECLQKFSRPVHQKCGPSPNFHMKKLEYYKSYDVFKTCKKFLKEIFQKQVKSTLVFYY